ncbi:MAG: hypothetical protein O3B41_01960 [Bacteroidetes bacterium]|nr:hypothetical protein [Bacteroidota bacterium]
MTEKDIAIRLIVLADLIERPPRSLIELKSIQESGSTVSFEPSDDFAAAHYQVLCHELMPAASVFLEPGSVMGSVVSERVWTKMWTAGFEPDTSSVLADHLSSSLRFVAFLIENGRIQEAGDYLKQELLIWMPPFLDRLGTFDLPEMTHIALLLEEVVDYILDAPKAVGGPLPPQTPFPSLPESGLHLEDERTNLAAIAEYLASHAASGLFVTKSSLAVEARRHRIPIGFGSRSRSIEGLLRSAAQYDALGPVCDFLDSEITTHRATWDRWASKGASYWAAEWSKKLNITSEVVRQLRQAESADA